MSVLCSVFAWSVEQSTWIWLVAGENGAESDWNVERIDSMVRSMGPAKSMDERQCVIRNV